MAAPINPCTTASPVDCTYRAYFTLGTKSKIYSYLADRNRITLDLFGSASHVDNILNAVFKEGPGILVVWGGVLNHHQLCGVIDAR